jgi:hypothetical protein
MVKYIITRRYRRGRKEKGKEMDKRSRENREEEGNFGSGN